MENVFYHGTYEDSYNEIVEKGVILNSIQEADETSIINDVLNSYSYSNVRNGAVFLTDNEKEAECYECNIKIDINNLNTNLLYVADNDITNNILNAYFSKNKKKMNYFIRKYLRSLIPFDKYKDIEKEYNSIHPHREYLYFNSINLVYL
ncbi:hypothetical protein BFS06_14245 [Clostridium perfringens]|uniref:hypothetical protein n=1 Tax=Clostridium perfringens TaxID=1502 RepID=UPI00103CE3B5|nr:hypothetical protein [Clostridium perfringens]TBX14366.1 hypothetical protein BFS06_14245 [Clostridium perfringens]